jgi:3-deoxy-D-manno-octulosonic acid kinase
MAGIDTSENLTPFRITEGGVVLEGAILFDATRLRQAEPGWFDPAWWGTQAQVVGSGGRGGAWFVNQPDDANSSKKMQKKTASVAAKVPNFGPAVLRHYLRGGLAARLSRDRHLWRGPGHVRSFDEFRLLRALRRLGVAVPEPIAAIYWRKGASYRAAILLDRLQNVRALADLAAGEDDPALWRRTGELIARLHRVGLDHADLNAHNILFEVGPLQSGGKGWIIDLDRSRIRIPATAWREANLQRLERSLLKLRGARSPEQVREDMRRLREAYDMRWQRGI